MHHMTELRSVTKDIASGLQVLKARIAAARIPSSKLDESFNLATWNIREFGNVPRSEAAIHYIAEVLGQFDLISVIEVRDNLHDLARVLDVLGPYWRAVYSDALTDAGGNRERVAFVYDKRQIIFNGMASAAFSTRIQQGTEWVPELNWWRPPYLASFKSGSFDFVLFAVHIRWGATDAGRLAEIQGVADWISEKVKLASWIDRDIFVMGDFNIPDLSGPLFKAITSGGLIIPEALINNAFGSNLAKNMRYDQILHLPQYPENFTNTGGVLDFYAGDYQPLFPDLSLLEFTFQMSDHLPLWIQVNTDIEGHKLDQIIQSG